MTEPALHGTEDSRCGFVAVVGAPNVGKSTLVNRLVGHKVSIVSPKVQTTRSRVLGIALIGRSQVLLVDTPGLFDARRPLDAAMVAAAWEGARGADDVLLVVDSTRPPDASNRQVATFLARRARPGGLVLNKVDAVSKPRLLDLAREFDATGAFRRIFMVSALTGDGVAALAEWLAEGVPPGPWLYPEDQISDVPQAMLAAEITREKLFRLLHHELPYAIAVETSAWSEGKDGSVRIDQTIFVERAGQRAIVLGEGGRTIRRIGEQSRVELERLLDRRVHLFLFVKVRESWRDHPDSYRLYGLDLPKARR